MSEGIGDNPSEATQQVESEGEFENPREFIDEVLGDKSAEKEVEDVEDFAYRIRQEAESRFNQKEVEDALRERIKSDKIDEAQQGLKEHKGSKSQE